MTNSVESHGVSHFVVRLVYEFLLGYHTKFKLTLISQLVARFNELPQD